MKRYLVSLLSVLFLFALPASGQQSETMRINADRVNLRRAPSVDSGIVRALAKGTLVTVVSRDGNWVKVQLQGQTATGWVRSDLLVAVPTASAPPPPAQPSAPSGQGQRNLVAPPPPPPPPVAPPAARRVDPPRPPKPPKAPSAPGNSSYRGGFTVFGGITSFTGVVTPAPGFTLENASGFMGGIGIVKHIGGPVGIEIDGAYVQKGSAETVSGTKFTEHDNYAQGALLLRPAFGSGAVRVFLLGGGEVGYLLGCKFATTGTGPAGTCTIPTQAVSRIDYGLLVGGGVSFGPLAVQVRYDLGIANLSKTAGVTAKNKGLMVLGSLIL